VLANTVATGFAEHTRVLPFAGRYQALRRGTIAAAARTSVGMPSRMTSRALVRRIALCRYADRDAVEFAHGIVARCRPDLLGAWIAALRGLDVLAGLDKLSVPTTVVVGDEDRLTPPALARQIADVLRRRDMLHRYVELPRVGHCASLEAPQAFTAEIERLVALAATPRR
jgi:pimeloyl-ACP methyl ester carboxylesterase